MAVPAFRAAGTAVFSANNVANPTALTPTKSGSTVNGDLMLCITECRSITATVSTPSGWTLLTGFPIRSGTASGGSVYVFSRIADGTADDAPTITWTGVTTGTNGDSCGARIIAWQNAVAIQAGTVTSTDAASTTTVTMPAITTTFGNALIVGVVVKINDTVHTWSVATRTERSDDHTTTGTGHGTVTCDLVQTAVGASGTSVATPSTTVSSRTLAISIAMKPVIVTATVGQATETDTARHLAVPFGRATETDTAQATGRRKTKAIAQATEADTSRRLAVPVGRATETDTAGALLAPLAYDVAVDVGGPISHWKLGDASGPAVDRKGVSNAAAVGSPTFAVTGLARAGNRSDGAVALSGGAKLSAPYQAAYNVSTYVLEAWINLDRRPASGDFYYICGRDFRFNLCVNSDGILRAFVNSGSLTAATTALLPGRTYHVVVKHDGAGTVRYYVDGVLDREITGAGNPSTDTTSKFQIGGDVGGAFQYEGRIDEVAFYSTLSDARIAANYAAGAPAMQTVAIGRATDTETARALTSTKLKAIGQATDAETAAVLTPVQTGSGQTITAGQATETDSASVTTAHKTLAIAQATDTETAGAVSAGKIHAIAAAGETDSASAASRLKSRATAAALETDTPAALAQTKLRAIAAALEADSASAASRLKSRATAAALETDTAAALAHAKLRELAAALEADTAAAVARTKARALGEAVEADAAPGVLRVAVTGAAEADSARVVASQGHVIELALAVETDTAEAAARVKVKAILAAAETDTAPAAGHGKLAGIALAEETSVAAALTVALAYAVSPALETDSALAASPGKATLLLYAAEANIAVAITPVGGAAPATDVRPTRGFVATIHEGTVSRAAPGDSGIDAGLVARIRTGSVDQ